MGPGGKPIVLKMEAALGHEAAGGRRGRLAFEKYPG
jgi:hypothetical protein